MIQIKNETIFKKYLLSIFILLILLFELFLIELVPNISIVEKINEKYIYILLHIKNNYLNFNKLKSLGILSNFIFIKLKKEHFENSEDFKQSINSLKYNKNELFFEISLTDFLKNSPNQNMFFFLNEKFEKDNNEDNINYDNIFDFFMEIKTDGNKENLLFFNFNQISNLFFYFNQSRIGVNIPTKKAELPLVIKLISDKKILFSELYDKISFDKLYLDGFSILLRNNKIEPIEKKTLLIDKRVIKPTNCVKEITEKDISDIRFKIETFFNNVRLDINRIKYLREKKNKKILKIINSHLEKSNLDIEIKKELYKIFNEKENLKDIDIILSNLIESINTAINSKLELNKKIWEKELIFFKKIYDKVIKIDREKYILNSKIKIYDLFYNYENNDEILAIPEVLIIQQEKIIASNDLFFISHFLNIPINNIEVILNKNLFFPNISNTKKNLKILLNNKGIFKTKFSNLFLTKIASINFENIQTYRPKNKIMYFIFSENEEDFKNKTENIAKKLNNLFLNIEVISHGLLIIAIQLLFLTFFVLLCNKPLLLIMWFFSYLFLSILAFAVLNIFFTVILPFVYILTYLVYYYLNKILKIL